MVQRQLPWILHAAALSQFLPILAGLRFGFRMPSPRGWISVWCLTLLASDALSLWIRGSEGHNNLWLQPIVVPIQNAIVLWALSLWQDDPVSRLAFRLAIPLYLLALVALIPAIQSTATFDQFTWPFQALVLLAASLYTLVTRGSAEPDRVSSRDWFWVTLGLSLFFSLRIVLPPFVQLTIGPHPELARLAYLLRAWTDVAAYGLIARGMLCPPPPARFGGIS